MTVVRFIEHDGTITDVRFRTLRAARDAMKLISGIRCCYILTRPPSKIKGKSQ